MNKVNEHIDSSCKTYLVPVMKKPSAPPLGFNKTSSHSANVSPPKRLAKLNYYTMSEKQLARLLEVCPSEATLFRLNFG